MGQSDELFLRAGFAGDTRPPGPDLGGDIVLHDITDVFSDATLVAFTQGIRPGLYDELDDPPVGAIIESANDGHLYWVHRDGNVHLLCDSGGYGGAAVWGSITGTLADQTDLIAALNALSAGIAGKQAADAELSAIAALSSAADKGIQFVGAGVAGLFDLTAAAKTVLDDPTVGAMVDTLGGAASTGTGGLVRTTSPALAGTPTAPTASGGTNTTQIATTAFVSAAVSSAVSGLLDLKGDLACAANPNYPAGSVGDLYYVSTAGKIGGASGKTVEIGDAIVCKVDNAGGTEAAVGTSWFVLEKSLNGALLSANNLSDVANAATARTNLGLAIGSNVQAFSANLQSIASISFVADQSLYWNGTAFFPYSVTSAARTVLDDTTVAAMVDTLGGAASTGSGGLARATSPAFAGTPTAPTAAGGTATTQIATTAFVGAAVSSLGALLSANNLSDVANAATARTNLGLAIGSQVQAYHANLAALAGLTNSADSAILFTGVGAAVYTVTSAARTVLDDTSVANMVNTLGGATSSGTGGLVRITSPALLGTPTAPTAALGTDTGQIATTAFVQNAIEDIVKDVVPSAGQAANRYLSSYISFAVTTVALVANELRYFPFQVCGMGTTITRIGVNVTTAHSSLIRLGVYPAATGVPNGAPLLDAGTVSASTTGIKEITISLALAPGWYWLAILSEGTPTVTADDLSAGCVNVGMGAIAANGGPFTECKEVLGAFGALPSTGSVTRLATSIVPRVWGRRV